MAQKDMTDLAITTGRKIPSKQNLSKCKCIKPYTNE